MSSLPELRAPKAPVATDPSAATNEVVRLHVLMKLVAAIFSSRPSRVTDASRSKHARDQRPILLCPF